MKQEDTPVKKSSGLKGMLWKAIGVSATLALITFLVFTGAGQAYLAPNVLKGGHGDLKITCTKCHVPFSGVPDLACQSCHKGIARAQLLKKGLHGGAVGNCEKCHSMHRGKKAGLIKDNLDHERLSFSLKKHEETSCAGCHRKNLRADTSAKCLGCHIEDKKLRASFGVHLWGLTRLSEAAKSVNATYLATDAADLLLLGAIKVLPATASMAASPPVRCSACHIGGGTVRYNHGKVATDYKRAEFFVSEHKKASCTDCHGRNNFQTEANACSECHNDARTHGPIAGGCSKCHVSKAWKPAKSGHDPALAGAHLKLDCRECHTVKKRLAKSMKACASCHQGKHRSFTSGQSCLACHNQGKWSQSKFTHNAGSTCRNCHGKPRGHYSGSCSSCHSSSKNWKRGTAGKHPGASSSCTSCHRKPRGHYSSSCAQCHKVGTTWKTSGKGALSHPGLGATCSNCHNRPRAHYSGSCSKCHSSTKSWGGARFSHPRVREHSWRSFSCSSCHPRGYSSTNCTTCHSQNGGDDDESENDDSGDGDDDDDDDDD